MQNTEKKDRIDKKIKRVIDNLDDNSFCKLILLNDDILIGFISIFPYDGYTEYTPWYATMYVKKEYRNMGYSRVLNDAILKEAKSRGFTEVYLKTELENYYEKFGAVYIKKLTTKEKLYKFNLGEG